MYQSSQELSRDNVQPAHQQLVIAVLLHPNFFQVFYELPKKTISRNYKITSKRLLSCAKELVQNVPLGSRVSQSIMVASAHCGLIPNGRSRANGDFSCEIRLLVRSLRIIIHLFSVIATAVIYCSVPW